MGCSDSLANLLLRRVNEKPPMDDYFAWPRPEVRALLEPRGPILDIGCGAGMVCADLAASGTRVVGVEADPSAAERAQERYAKVHVGPLEAFHSTETFAQAVFADVLEHLVDPWGELRRITDSLLMPGGRVVVSVPNVRHWTVLRDLALRGRWDYTEAGLLDRTHLRFFTKGSCEALLMSAGLRIESLMPHFERRLTRAVSAVSLGLLTEFVAIQWLAVARKPSA